MAIKTVHAIMYEASDGMMFETLEKATAHELELQITRVVERFAYRNISTSEIVDGIIRYLDEIRGI